MKNDLNKSRNPCFVIETSVKERGGVRENLFVFVHLPRVFGKDKLKSVLLQNLWD